MIGCSGSHRDSKPNDSALCARTATSIDRLESVIFTPIFIVPSMISGCLYRAKCLLQHNESIGLCSGLQGRIPSPCDCVGRGGAQRVASRAPVPRDCVGGGAPV